jgi:hypothetical protein
MWSRKRGQVLRVFVPSGQRLWIPVHEFGAPAQGLGFHNHFEHEHEPERDKDTDYPTAPELLIASTRS